MEKLVLYFIKLIGLLLLLVGIVASYYGPLEIYVFYLFSKGGRFYYYGFGIGSLWFAYLVIQNIGYYIIAVLCIPIGIGHLNIRRWALTITRLYIWFWLGSGILIIVNLIGFVPNTFKLDLTRDVLISRLTIVGLVALTVLILLPILFIRLYYSTLVKSIFEENDQNSYWTEDYPLPILALLGLIAIMILTLHIAIFFQAIFPLFGSIIHGRQTIYLISFCILILAMLTFGIARLKIWAWWGSLITFSLMGISSYLTFSQHSIYDIIQILSLPSIEIEFIDRLGLIHDFHLTSFFTVPFVIAIGLLIYSKKFFEKHEIS